MSDDLQPGARIDGETDPAYEAFQHYRDSGPTVSLAFVARTYYPDTPTKLRTLEEWSSKYDWVERRAQYWDRLAEERRMLRESAIAKAEIEGARHLHLVFNALLQSALDGDPRSIKDYIDRFGPQRKKVVEDPRELFQGQVTDFDLSDKTPQELIDLMSKLAKFLTED